MKVGDVLAFTMRAASGEEITVVHRLISIEQGKDGEMLYTLRGDANSASMAGESQITRDRLIGVFKTSTYSGVNNSYVGYFITYMRSTTGITMCAVALIMMLVYLVLSDRMDKKFDERFAIVKHEELQRLFDCTDSDGAAASTEDSDDEA